MSKIRKAKLHTSYLKHRQSVHKIVGLPTTCPNAYSEDELTNAMKKTYLQRELTLSISLRHFVETLAQVLLL